MNAVRLGFELESAGILTCASGSAPTAQDENASPPRLANAAREFPDGRRSHLANTKGLPPRLLHELQARRDSIAQRWAELLYIEPINGPLANPDALIHLIPYSLELLFAALARKNPEAPGSLTAARVPLADCCCGKNPYHGYFTAGIQAVTESFVLLQTGLPPNERRESDLAAVIYAVRRLAGSEITTFCGVCSYRGIVRSCSQPATLTR